MNLKREAKIGLIVITTIGLVIWGINFLKGKNVLKRSDVYYTVFPDIGGLEKSAAIYINGYKIGMINDIHFEKGNLKEIIVSFAVHHDFEIPSGSVAELFNTTIIGSKAIRIVPSSSSVLYTYGDTIPSRIEADLFSSLQDEISPLTDKASGAIQSADSLINAFNEVMDEQGRRDLKSSLSNLNSITLSLRKQLGPEGDLNQTLGELKKFSAMLGENREKLDTIFTNLAAISDSLGQANVKEVVSGINTTFEQSSLLLSRINQGEGSLGLLTTNDSLYNSLKASTESLNILLADLKEHPKRYVHFSVFGKKDKEKSK